MTALGQANRTNNRETGCELERAPSLTAASSSSTAEPPDGGVTAWLMVAGSFLLCFNSWCVSLALTLRDPFDRLSFPLSSWVLTLFDYRGFINSFGSYQEYYSAVLLKDHSSSSISWIDTVQGFLIEFVGVLVGPIFDRGHFHMLIYLGSFLVVLGNVILSFYSKYWQIFLAQGIYIGLSSGSLFVPCISIVAAAFTKRRALAIGITTSASSIGKPSIRQSANTNSITGGIAYPIIFQRLQPRIGFPWAARATALLALVTLIISSLFLRRYRPRSTKPRALVDTSAFQSLPFMLYITSLVAHSAAYFVPFFYIPPFAIFHLSATPTTSLYTLAIVNAGGFIGRLIPGFLPTVLASVEVLPLASIAAGVVVFAWIKIGSLNGFIAICFIYGVLSGVMITMLTLLVPRLSPPEALHETIGTRLGMAYAGCGIGILIGSPIAGALIDLESGNFARGQAFAGAMFFGAALLMAYPSFIVKTKLQRAHD